MRLCPKSAVFFVFVSFLSGANAFTGISSLSPKYQSRFRSLRKATLETFEPGCAPWKLHRVDRVSDWITNGGANLLNPLRKNGRNEYRFIKDSEAVIKSVIVDTTKEPTSTQTCFTRAGPRERIYFAPKEVKAAIVTCGGICPGLNTVIREVVHCLSSQYGVDTVYGVLGGYRGFYDQTEWKKLTPNSVDQIHTLGGTVLGTSRGGHDTQKIVDALEEKGINMVFIVGGDGTMHGATKIAKESRRRGMRMSTIGIPKTVDNDIPFIDKSFGFESAVEESQRAIKSAHVEASSFPHGLGIVQLMGRNSGFIALHATLGSRDVDCVLIPEIQLELKGRGGLLEYIKTRMQNQGHVVIVVAEGAARDQVLAASHAKTELDLNGVPLPAQDVGRWLTQEIKSYFATHEIQPPITSKFVNPSYMVRSIPANAADNIYCSTLAHGAVHGAFAGITNVIVGPMNSHNAYVPLELMDGVTNVVSTKDEMWSRAVFSTGQPDFMNSKSLEKCHVSSDTTSGGCTVDLKL